MNSLEECIKQQFTPAANDLCLEPNKSIKLKSDAQMGYFFGTLLRSVTLLHLLLFIYTLSP